MSSAAGQAFAKNCEDIDRLLEIHGKEGGSGPGRRHRLEVLNKSAFVLITAFWEAYCEDVAAEALDYIVKHAKDAGKLPKDLRKIVANELESDKNELAIWRVADKGWRRVLATRLKGLQLERNRRLNTPKTAQINELFLQALGLRDISKSWYWSGMAVTRATKKLDDHVTLRGAIAHRGQGAAGVRKVHVDDYYDHVKRLVSKTDARVCTAVEDVTGQAPW